MADDFVMTRYEEKLKSKNLLPFKLGYLPDFMVTKAKEELGETEERKTEAILELRRLLEKETNLVCPRDDEYLLQYLRARKFNVKKAFKVMLNYYHVKKSYKEVYDACDPEMLRKFYATGIGYILPYRDSDGCMVHVVQIRKWDPDAFTIAELFLALTMQLLRSIEEPATQICGVHVLFDVKGLSWRQIRCVTPRMLNLLAKALSNHLPIRFKSIHLCDESVVSQYIWRLLKLFLSEKIVKRVHFYGDNHKKIHKSIPKIILPKDYGGDYPLDPCDWYRAEIEHYLDRCVEILTYGYRD